MRTHSRAQTVKQFSCCFALMLTVLIAPMAGAQDTYALEFDDQESEYLVTQVNGILDGVSQATIEMWVHVDPRWLQGTVWRNVGGITSGTGSSSGSNYTFGFLRRDQEENIALKVDTGWPSTAIPFGTLLNQWVHLAGVFDSGEARMYVNGEFLTSYNSGQEITELNSDGNPLYLSSTSSGYNPGQRGFVGMITDVRLWATARTESEIRQYMASDLSGSEEGLVTYLPLNEGTGDTASDLTAFDNHGTIVGARWVQVLRTPDVLDGQESATVEDAEALLTDGGFVIGDPIYDFSDTVPQGLVMGQLPATGVYVTAGDEIQLIISAGPTPRYVAPGGAGATDGTSWGNAYASIQDALDDAATAGADVWVAEGLYPLTSQIQWPDGVKAYGGFPVGGTWEDRNHWVYETILEPFEMEASLIRMRVDGSTGNRLDGFTLRNAAGFRGALWLGGYEWWGEDIVPVEATVANCTFINNVMEQGAAITAENTCTLYVENCMFINNRAEGDASLGGAILYGHDASGHIINSVFLGNSSEKDSWGGGGAIFLNGPDVEISYCTIYGNTIDEGTGSVITNQPTLSNSIIWGNSPNAVSGDATYVNTIHSNDIDVDPLFVDAEAGNLRLMAGSPAIEAGTEPWPSTDIRGTERPVGAAADIGAYEYVPPIYVTSTGAGAEDGSTWEDAFGASQLQDALDVAGATGSPVWVAGGEYDPGDTLLWPSNAHAYGGFAVGDLDMADRDIAGNETILTGADTRRVILLDQVTNIRIDGFTITEGIDELGGGIRIADTDDTIVIAHCMFLDNSATNRGGAIYMVNARPLVTDCVFMNNHSDVDGGGIYLYPGDTSPTIMNCMFVENTSGTDGGGMFIRDDCRPLVANSVFLNNAARRGAGIYNRGGDATNPQRVVNSTFVNNNATERGGGYYCDGWPGGRGAIVNSIFWGNTAPDQGPQVRDDNYVVVRYSNVQDGFPGDGNIDEDPLFVDVAAGNLQLQENSPSIDVGDPAGVPPAPARDILGTVRPQGAGVDMGAYEHSVGEPVVVPDLVIEGWTLEDVTAALEAAGLTVGIVNQVYSNDVPAGEIVSQDPVPGSQLAQGSAVNLTVSRGPAPAEMPLNGLAILLMVLAVMAAALGSKALLQRAN